MTKYCSLMKRVVRLPIAIAFNNLQSKRIWCIVSFLFFPIIISTKSIVPKTGCDVNNLWGFGIFPVPVWSRLKICNNDQGRDYRLSTSWRTNQGAPMKPLEHHSTMESRVSRVAFNLTSIMTKERHIMCCVVPDFKVI